MSNQRRASVAFVLATLGLDAIGVGIIAPIVPELVRQLGGLPPERAAPWVGALIASYAFVQFFAAPLLGELSDRFGRRPVILISVFGIGCDYILLALAPNLWWLFAGRLIAGATSANVAAATAYIADISTKENRPRLFGLIGATFGAGFVIGPALGGFLGARTACAGRSSPPRRCRSPTCASDCSRCRKAWRRRTAGRWTSGVPIRSAC